MTAAKGSTGPAKATPAKGTPGKTVAAKATVTKGVPVKSAGAGRKGRADSGSESNLHKRVDSERIAAHIAAFEKSGGRVEKLGITRVLQKVDEATDAGAKSAPAATPPARQRKR